MTNKSIKISGINSEMDFFKGMSTAGLRKPGYRVKPVNGKIEVIGMRFPVQGLRFKKGRMGDKKALACAKRLRILGHELGALAIEVAVICETGSVELCVS